MKNTILFFLALAVFITPWFCRLNRDVNVYDVINQEVVTIYEGNHVLATNALPNRYCYIEWNVQHYGEPVYHREGWVLCRYLDPFAPLYIR